MEQKLKSILKGEHWSLAIKAAVLSLSWLYTYFFIFVVLAFFLFFFSGRSKELAFSFFAWILTVCFFPNPILETIWPAVFIFISFYLLAGTKNFLFIRREVVFRIFSVATAALVFASLFFSFSSNFLFLAGIAAFNVLAFSYDLAIFREGAEKKKFFLSLVSALIFLEAVLVLKNLPIGFLNQTAVALLSFLTLEEVIIKERGKNKKVLGVATIFVFTTLFIFFLAGWEL